MPVENDEKKESGQQDQAPSESPASQQQQQEESFIDPATLPEELKPHWKRMHGTFARKMGEINKSKEKIEAYDRFMTDNEYAKQTILAYASQLGLTVTEAQAAANYAASVAKTNRGNPISDAPQQLVQAVRERLSPELQWMADSIASAHWEANRLTIGPVLARLEGDKKKQRENEYDRYAAQLTEKVPGWENQEDAMNAIREFILDETSLYHPTYGSKLELFYNLATSNSRATQEAINRFSQAARNRSSIGGSGPQSQSNIAERVLKAKTEQEAWEIAANDAVKQVGAK